MKTRTIIGLAILTAALMGQAAPQELKRVVETDFGTTADGKAVQLFTLSNGKGMQVRICSYGGTIAGIRVPDKDGNATNVEACADTLQRTIGFAMQAQTIGRVANRIAGGKFTLDGKEYTTEVNNGPNTLHSGKANFGTRVWDARALEPKAHEGAVELSMASKEGDGGFPGNLTLKVTYALNDDNEFSLTYEATTDKATPVNVTNHAYFNLAGAPGWGNPMPARGGTGAAVGGSEQELWIDADKYLVTDAGLVPTGEMKAVKDTPLDFTKATVIASRIPQLAPMRNYDHAFVLNSGGGKMATVARLRDPRSGRTMEVRTDQPGLQLYTGQAAGVALETQHHPDALHHGNFQSIVVKPGETMKTTTVYAFSAK
jgi:aldose 1-epimerase